MEFRLRTATSADDCIIGPDCLEEDYLLKNFAYQSGFLCPKFQHFSRVGEKGLLDNTTGIRYLNQ